MAQLTVNKVKYNGVNITIADIEIVNGKIIFVPYNKKYQYLKLTPDNCSIVS